MNSPLEFLRRIRMLLQRRQFQADLDEEMRLHLELRTEQQAETGLTHQAARHVAYRRFGNPTAIKEKSHRTWGWEWLESFVNDVHYGVRSMLRSPVLTLVALLSLGLGIGANTAIFSFMDAVMLRSLPVKDPHDLFLFGTGAWAGITDSIGSTELYSYPFYRAMQKQNAVFSDVGAALSMLNEVHGTVEGRNETERMHVQLVTGTYFPMLGVKPLIGRMLADDDDRIEGGHPVAVISYAWWVTSLARDPNILSKKVKLGETTFNIIGVAPPEFFGTKVGEAPDLWVPLAMMEQVPPNWRGYKDNFSQSLQLMGRLKPGVTLDQATSNVNLLYQQIQHGFPDAKLNQQTLKQLQEAHVPLTPMSKGLSYLRGQFSQPLRILMVLVAVVLLIACANLANLLLARSTARIREFAVRQALGARRSRLIRQLLTESLLLAFAGGALGIAFASVANRLLLRMVSGGPEDLPLDVSINPRLLLFTLTITVLTAVLFGTLPALRATKLELTDALKDSRGPQTGTGKSPLAKILVISQIVFSLVLLVGAGLFVRTLVNLSNIDTGFNKEDVLLLRTDPSSIGYKGDDPRVTRLYQQIEERVGALHGVTTASFSLFTFNEGSWNGGITVPGVDLGRSINVKHNVIGNDYFKAMGIPLLAGRTFGPQDTTTSQKVSIISERLAKTYFPKTSPLGRHYSIGGADSPEREIIGIVKDVKFGNLSEDPETLDYVSYSQRPQYENDLVVRYTGDFAAISGAIQQAIHSVDRNLPIAEITTLDEQVGRSITQQRTVAQLSAFFGLLAVFLSCIGIYGLMSYVVSRRTNEIGIRMALGARRGNVRWLVMREITLLLGIGIGIGVPVTLAGTRMIQTMLFGVKGSDPASLVASVTLLLAIGLLAGYLPARRASRVDPMVALRYE
ncbi:ABC transporter permease [Terriglobus saanensis]|uniref:Permease n=1 Tax=Terriglobus saanensis (strain ATCC BAA-1853 / DSM 23119 / SP1PR4) TaxID=401053 RepID=E8UZR4_TERSS|nr:ABC transporter permease [Terriglobus saanensis]ADV84407.1 permease [Terriglobus saanensis SP1PR4]